MREPACNCSMYIPYNKPNAYNTLFELQLGLKKGNGAIIFSIVFRPILVKRDILEGRSIVEGTSNEISTEKRGRYRHKSTTLESGDGSPLLALLMINRVQLLDIQRVRSFTLRTAV